MFFPRQKSSFKETKRADINRVTLLHYSQIINAVFLLVFCLIQLCSVVSPDHHSYIIDTVGVPKSTLVSKWVSNCCENLLLFY